MISSRKNHFKDCLSYGSPTKEPHISAIRIIMLFFNPVRSMLATFSLTKSLRLWLGAMEEDFVLESSKAWATRLQKISLSSSDSSGGTKAPFSSYTDAPSSPLRVTVPVSFASRAIGLPCVPCIQLAPLYVAPSGLYFQMLNVCKAHRSARCPETLLWQTCIGIRMLLLPVTSEPTRPPMRSLASKIVTLIPLWSKMSAHLRPATPAPTMHTCGVRPMCHRGGMTALADLVATTL